MNYKRIVPIALAATLILSSCNEKGGKKAVSKPTDKQAKTATEAVIAPVDTAVYLKKLKSLANGDTTGLWPMKTKVFPQAGAILPFKRIIAYYGNLYSKKMGILGEVPPKELWRRLNIELAAWKKADPATPVQPAIHYIAIVASGSPLKDGKYRTRMPEHQIDSALAIAKMGNAIVFLDIQVSLSNVQTEVPTLEKYLKMPNVHLGIDPEFSMKDGSKPGKRIGTMDATDVNFCSDYLAKLVQKNKLTPKILIVHRFTQGMLRNYKNIKLHPEVQIVINMDGWGEPTLKHSTYKLYIYKEPVQFTGFKLFYKNDIKKAPNRMLTPDDLMKLRPQPIYIQYQ
jgi:hypothetical protein